MCVCECVGISLAKKVFLRYNWTIYYLNEHYPIMQSSIKWRAEHRRQQQQQQQRISKVASNIHTNNIIKWKHDQNE